MEENEQKIKEYQKQKIELEKIKEENFEEAYYILKENNIFSHICSIICPQEDQCEGSCVRGIKSTPTSIGKLEQFVNEWAIERRWRIYNIYTSNRPSRKQKRRKKNRNKTRKK